MNKFNCNMFVVIITQTIQKKFGTWDFVKWTNYCGKYFVYICLSRIHGNPMVRWLCMEITLISKDEEQLGIKTYIAVGMAQNIFTLNEIFFNKKETKQLTLGRHKSNTALFALRRTKVLGLDNGAQTSYHSYFEGHLRYGITSWGRSSYLHV